MNLYKLKYFIVTAEELNISKAAERLFISQQALSSQIGQLEQHYGVKLFERRPNLALTYAGSRLLEQARLLVQLNDQIEAEMESIRKNRRGSLRIGISYARGNLFASRVLPIYHRKYPAVDLTLVEGNSAELCGFLENARVDVIVDFSPILLRDITTVRLLKERVFMVVPQTFMEQYGGPSRDVEALFKAPLLLLSKDSFLRNILDRYFKKQHITPNIVLESKNIATLCSLCRQNMGVTFCSEMYARQMGDTSGLTLLPMADDLSLGELVIAYPDGPAISPALRDFVELAKSFFSESEPVQ